jgi:glycosyltransferase involved in cell wall biosynthesis
MNICFVSREYVDSKRAGGIATYVDEMSRALVVNGHNVFVLCASDNIFREQRYKNEGVEIIKMGGADFFIHKNRYVRYIGTILAGFLNYNRYRRKIVRVLLDLDNVINLDIIEFPEYGNEAKFWLGSEKRTGKTIVRFHGPNGYDARTKSINIQKKRNIEVFNTAFKADGITFCSIAIFDLITKTKQVKDLYTKFSKNQKIIYNFINTEDREFASLNEEKYIFSAGSFTREKGFGELVEALKDLNNRGFKIKLLIAGKLGKLGVFYKNKAQNDERYKNWLKILGPLERESLFSLYKNAEICCFPSYFESFGLTCIEAMSVGGLVIGSTSGGMNEIINDGVDGYLVDPKSVELLINIIQKVWSLDETKKLEIRVAAKKNIEDKFGRDRILKETIRFYKDTI